MPQTSLRMNKYETKYSTGHIFLTLIHNQNKKKPKNKKTDKKQRVVLLTLGKY